jgi:DNA-binding NarL/FixJ family response regulator
VGQTIKRAIKPSSATLAQLHAFRSAGEFSKAVALADLMIGEAGLDQRFRTELLCTRSECQLRMALFAEALSSGLAALQEARKANAQDWIGRALLRVSAVYAGLQLFDLSIKNVEEAVEIHRKSGHKPFYVSALVALSAVRIHFDDFERAKRDAAKAARMAKEINAMDDMIKAKIYIAECCLHLGEYRAALKQALDAEIAAIAFDDHFLLAKSSYILGKCYIRLRQYADAKENFTRACERFRSLYDKGSLKSSIEWLARVHEARGEFKEATELYKDVLQLERELLVEHRQSIRIQLTENNQSFASRLLARAPELTATEIKLCELMLKFFSNKEIAKLLGISVLTVERHRFNIRKKLGLRSGSSLTAALLNT